MTNLFDEETDDPLVADVRNFYKVEKWTRDGSKVDGLLYASNNLDKSRDIFAQAIKHRPRIRLTIRQRMRVLDEWPRHDFADFFDFGGGLFLGPGPRGRHRTCAIFCSNSRPTRRDGGFGGEGREGLRPAFQFGQLDEVVPSSHEC